MQFQGREILLCNCERTMRLDGEAIGRALDGNAAGPIHSHLCRSEIAAFEQALEGDGAVMVACTQEAPLFAEIAREHGAEDRISYVNIRERAGWCEAKTGAEAKIAALLAEASLTAKPARLQSIESDGLCLVYGAGQAALDVARALADRLSVSLLLTDPGDLLPPDKADVAVQRGRIVRASGVLGRFEIEVDGYAPIMPSARGRAEFVMPRDGAASSCSLILDMSGGAPLFSGRHGRDGYLRVDPRDPAALARAMFDISALVGTFEKPIYVDYDPDICAHSRSRITGCTNCLDACPTGAITSTGDTVAIDNGVCGGCGTCGAVCPTGAASYEYPRRDDLVRRIQTLAGTYLRAGGRSPKLLVHDDGDGAALISAMARLGRGLPVNVIPLSVFSVLQFGHDMMAAAFVAGFEDVLVLAAPQQADEVPPVEAQARLANAVLAGIGHQGTRVQVIVEADPDIVEAALHDLPQRAAMPADEIAAVGGKREIAHMLLAKLNASAPAPAGMIALEVGAPYGRIHVDGDGCTLCLACVSACPTGAILDNPDKPQIRLVEQACVQCGLCAKTCPEKVITLEPRLNLSNAALSPILLNEEEPFACIQCGKAFGTKKTIDRVVSRLQGKHWMFPDEHSVRLIQMCDDCRVATQAASPADPFRGTDRPAVRTTDDYLRAREQGRDLSAEDFLSEG